MAELEMQQEPADMMSLNDALALMRKSVSKGHGAQIGPALLAGLVGHISNLEAERNEWRKWAVSVRISMDAKSALLEHARAGEANGAEALASLESERAANAALTDAMLAAERERDELRARLAEIEAQTPIENGAELLDLASRLRKGLPIFGGGYVRIAKALEHLAATNGQRAAQLEAIDEFDAAKRGER